MLTMKKHMKKTSINRHPMLGIQIDYEIDKVGCGFKMIDVSILLNEEFGRNDHREDALHFSSLFE